MKMKPGEFEIIKTVVLLHPTRCIGRTTSPVERHYDYLVNCQGCCIQRNGRTLAGRLNDYGGLELFAEYINADLERGWTQEEEESITNQHRYDHAVAGKINTFNFSL